MGQGGILYPDVSDITGPKIPVRPTQVERPTPACGDHEVSVRASALPNANLMITAAIGLPPEWSGNGATIGGAPCAVPGSPNYRPWGRPTHTPTPNRGALLTPAPPLADHANSPPPAAPPRPTAPRRHHPPSIKDFCVDHGQTAVL
ncbi:hypothetical protein Prum_044780 [Phytohabitans rumicis]|uniref:Uncharacterized protein n=1 Tax=Phytohabitans rumicis TaxID=1076125 RepID=A0A6V8L9T1_9ACTN|nr:hypothetical protein Prum_044780 [Phytohabitans rumicis]